MTTAGIFVPNTMYVLFEHVVTVILSDSNNFIQVSMAIF